MAAQAPYDVVLFDLGGVLVELGGAPVRAEWARDPVPVETLWQTWLESPAVQAFERGETSAEAFADALVREYRLEAAPADLLAVFAGWVKGFYPGTEALLAQLRRRCRVACLSNTNAVHWRRMVDEFRIEAHFDHCFASHLIGHVKPEPAVFRYVLDALGTAPERVLFIDDNPANATAARCLGLCACKAHGLDAVKACLSDHGLLDFRPSR